MVVLRSYLLREERGAPHQCALESVASRLCQCMLTPVRYIDDVASGASVSTLRRVDAVMLVVPSDASGSKQALHDRACTMPGSHATQRKESWGGRRGHLQSRCCCHYAAGEPFVSPPRRLASAPRATASRVSSPLLLEAVEADFFD